VNSSVVKVKYIVLLCVLISAAVLIKTCIDLQPVSSLHSALSEVQTVQVTDRAGQPLSVSYQNRWNIYQTVPLHTIPPLLQQAFILSEDKRFYSHYGVDWRARLGVLWSTLHGQRKLRGASTISEQVVRMMHPRPRNLWSKWLEGIEAWNLELQYSKPQILEFYLNQLPYASNRRGIATAARYYFNRDLTTLSHKEMLALTVLARAPSSFDLYKKPGIMKHAIVRLATILQGAQLLSLEEVTALARQDFVLNLPEPPINATHFVGYVRQHIRASSALHTTLDSHIQQEVNGIIEERLRSLEDKNVHQAAVVVANHLTGEILAWSVVGTAMNAVVTPRQPGSALKPFLYGNALDRGWMASTWIEDLPLSEAIGAGLHRFKNYSNLYYEKVTLREALANSLNIPALHTIQFVGVKPFLDVLHQLHFDSLDRDGQFYDEGLALGNGEVTLLELVSAYAALANRGNYRPLTFLREEEGVRPVQRVFSEQAASLIGNILSDPWARRLEFGTESVLNLPVQTAVKTGTSTDYRDAWTVGFDARYVVGIWMGNLDQMPMDGVTGSTGPALALRSIFSLLNRDQQSMKLYLSPALVARDICIHAIDDDNECTRRTEYFMSGNELAVPAAQHATIGISRPTSGLQMAIDPRIPRAQQKFSFLFQGAQSGDRVHWIMNGTLLAKEAGGEYLWPLERGTHRLSAELYRAGNKIYTAPEIEFLVK
jgi:penicillin-binding protein 1C